jgi:hypothetical protein
MGGPDRDENVGDASEAVRQGANAMTEFFFIDNAIRYFTSNSLGTIAGDFLFHTFWLFLLALVLQSLKQYAERNAAPKWLVTTLRVLYVPAYAYDVFYSSIFPVISVLFWEIPPRRKTKVLGVTLTHRLEPLTRRLQRHQPTFGYRGNVARVLCRLIALIPGWKEHCI